MTDQVITETKEEAKQIDVQPSKFEESFVVECCERLHDLTLQNIFKQLEKFKSHGVREDIVNNYMMRTIVTITLSIIQNFHIDVDKFCEALKGNKAKGAKK